MVGIFQGMEDSWSHKNTLEAKWCVALANYLRQMKYNPEEITVLATYTGQVNLIEDVSKSLLPINDFKNQRIYDTFLIKTLILMRFFIK